MTLCKTKIEPVDLFETKLSLIDRIKGEALVLTCTFLNNRRVKFNNILKFIKNPEEYSGNPDGPRKIFESNLNKIISKYRTEIRENNLTISQVYTTIMKQVSGGNKSRA